MTRRPGLVVGPRLRDLAGFTVNRVWPTARRRLIGPFIFLDHLQRVELPAGRGFDVPPHPHIGLATVTYLFEGELEHRDSLGHVQPIRPGELNWMTAGRGITHSERSSAAQRAAPASLHGIQAWVALPADREESAPAFEHYSGAGSPATEADGVRLRLLAGRAFGLRAAVETASPLFLVEADLDENAALELPADLGERGAYIVRGQVDVEGTSFAAGRLLVFEPGGGVELTARAPATKLMLLGGMPLDGERHISWNFVSSVASRIEAARRDWQAGRFPAVPGDPERMPMPGR